MARERVENCAILDVLELAREGYLLEGASGEKTWSRAGAPSTTLRFHAEESFLRLDLLQSGDVHNERPWPVELTRTRTSFGAERVWFYCPMCGGRVRKLYLPPGAANFGCRSCQSLSYASRQTRTWVYGRDWEYYEKLDEFLRRADRWIKKHRGEERASARTRYERGLIREKKPPRRPAAEAVPGPRPRGRPKEKRPYHRSTPFLSGKRPSEHHGLCLRCRDYRELNDPHAVTLANGRSARRGTCPICGATMVLIVKG